MTREISDQLSEAINQSSFGTDDVKQARQSVTAEEIATLQRKLAQKRETTMTTNELNLPPSHDTRRFTHNGYQCAVLMGPMTINGYIALPDGHPWLDCPDSLEVHPDIDVHGGITYHEGNTIGFDTGHLGDGQHPDAPHRYPSRFTGHIWNWNEVEAETRRLADQAKDTANA